jgi:nicotinamidase-related amidase
MELPEGLAQTLAEVEEMYRAKGVGNPLGFGEKAAVLVIDFQQAYTRTWRARSTEPVEQTARVLAAARAQGLPVFYTYQGYDPVDPDGGLFTQKAPTLLAFKRDTWETEIDPLIAPEAGDPVLEKNTPSAFFGSDLAEVLHAQGVDTVVVCGCSLSGCVRATVVDGMSHQFRMIVSKECVQDPSAISMAVSLMEINTKYGDVTPVDEVIAGIEALAPVTAS